MRRAMVFLLAPLSLTAIGRQAMAQDTTQAAAQIRVESYSPLKLTEVVGVIGQPTTITFPAGESVYRVVQSGKPDKDGTLADAGWEGASPSEITDTPLGNNLTLWPVVPGESTMSVITMSTGGTQKVIRFGYWPSRMEPGRGLSQRRIKSHFKGGATPKRRPRQSSSEFWPGVGSKAKSQTGRTGHCRTAFAHGRLQWVRCNLPLHSAGHQADTDRAALSNGQR